MTNDANFLVRAASDKAGGEILGEFSSYYEAYALWILIYKRNRAVVIQDVKAAQ